VLSHLVLGLSNRVSGKVLVTAWFVESLRFVRLGLIDGTFSEQQDWSRVRMGLSEVAALGMDRINGIMELCSCICQGRRKSWFCIH
jgi:hypothetical protein